MKMSDVLPGQRFKFSGSDELTMLANKHHILVVGKNYDTGLDGVAHFLYRNDDNTFFCSIKDEEVTLLPPKEENVKSLTLADLKPGQKFKLKHRQVVDQNLILLEVVSSGISVNHKLLGNMLYIYSGENNGVLYGSIQNDEVVLV